MHITSRYSRTTLSAATALMVTFASATASDLDDRIESAVHKSYVFKTYLKNDSIRTSSKDGVVTLTGSVWDSHHKSLAESTVEGLPGVKQVNNEITVKGVVEEERSDGWIGTKVKTTLLFHRNVSASGTDVYVKDGVVSLRGTASSQAQKDLTAEYAADVEGVKEVKNELTIAKSSSKREQTPGEKIDDASITAQVKMSLLSHRSTSAVKTTVTTRDGVVTVGGTAKNAAEKSLVTKLVNDINGVDSVINNMTIAVPVAVN